MVKQSWIGKCYSRLYNNYTEEELEVSSFDLNSSFEEIKDQINLNIVSIETGPVFSNLHLLKAVQILYPVILILKQILKILIVSIKLVKNVMNVQVSKMELGFLFNMI